MQEIAVIGVISFNKFVLVGRKIEDGVSKLCLLEETLTKEENPKDVLSEVIKEKTGVEIKVMEFLGESKNQNGMPSQWYKCPSKTPVARINNDFRLIWIPKEDIPNLYNSSEVSLWPKEVKKYFGIAP